MFIFGRSEVLTMMKVTNYGFGHHYQTITNDLYKQDMFLKV
jgi:hypothetical protein